MDSEIILQWVLKKDKTAYALCSRLTGKGGPVPRFPSPLPATVHDDHAALDVQLRKDIDKLRNMGYTITSKKEKTDAY